MFGVTFKFILFNAIYSNLGAAAAPVAGGAATTAAKVEEKPKNESKEMNRKPYDWPGLESELTDIIKDSSIAKKLMSVLKLHNESKECEEKYVTMPPLEKDQRRVVHEWVRNSLPCARSDSIPGNFVRIWHVKFEKEMPNYKTFWNPNKKRQKLSWPKDRPDFLRFVLYKGMRYVL